MKERIPISELDPRQALHMLQTYQEELELQNMELMRAKRENELLIEKYTTLYDQAPSGYLTLDREGRILELNMVALFYLYKDRHQLINIDFRRFVTEESRPVFDEFFEEIFEKLTKVSCDVSLSIYENTQIYTHLEGIASSDGQNCFVTIVDITVLKQTEEALKISRKEFESYFQNGSVGMSVFSPEKGWIELNQRLCQMFGYTKQELIGKTWMDLSHPEDLAANLHLFQLAVEGKLDRYQMDKRFIRKDGSILYATLSVAVQRNEDGTIHHLLSSYIDITDQKLAEEALRKSEEKFRTLLEFAPDAFFHGDENGDFIAVNDKAAEFTGFSKEELLSMNMADLFSEVVMKENPLRYDLAKAGMTVANERELTRKDGTIIQVEMNSKMMPDCTYQCLMTDITARKKTEDALKESEDRFRSIFEDSPDAIFLADTKSGVIIDANHAASRLLSRSIKEIIGMHHSKLHPQRDEMEARSAFLERAKKSRRDTQLRPIEMNVIRSDGKEVPVEILAKVITINGQQVLHGTFRDISKRKRREEELKKSELRFNILFDNIVDGLAYCRMLYEEGQPVDFIYLDVNPSFERITSLRNVRGRKVSEIIPGIRQTDPELFDIYSRVALTGKSEDTEIYVKTLNKWFHLSAYSPSKEQFVVIFNCIDERKRAEQELMEKAGELEQVKKLASAQEMETASLKKEVDRLLKELGPERGMLSQKDILEKS